MLYSLRIGVAAIAVVLFSTAAGHAAGEVVGRWRCEGKWVGGDDYSGNVVVTKRGESYEVVWNLGGGEKYTGVGIMDDDLFVAQFSGQGQAGVMLFRRKGAGWVGQWVRAAGKGLIHKETWTKPR